MTDSIALRQSHSPDVEAQAWASGYDGREPGADIKQIATALKNAPHAGSE